jgi:hypothetical protein
MMCTWEFKKNYFVYDKEYGIPGNGSGTYCLFQGFTSPRHAFTAALAAAVIGKVNH